MEKRKKSSIRRILGGERGGGISRRGIQRTEDDNVGGMAFKVISVSSQKAISLSVVTRIEVIAIQRQDMRICRGGNPGIGFSRVYLTKPWV